MCFIDRLWNYLTFDDVDNNDDDAVDDDDD